jgi:hypothetical protein
MSKRNDIIKLIQDNQGLFIKNVVTDFRKTKKLEFYEVNINTLQKYLVLEFVTDIKSKNEIIMMTYDNAYDFLQISNQINNKLTIKTNLL